jgi:predicted transposase YdaD
MLELLFLLPLLLLLVVSGLRARQRRRLELELIAEKEEQRRLERLLEERRAAFLRRQIREVKWALGRPRGLW